MYTLILKKIVNSLFALLPVAFLLFTACNNDGENDVTFTQEEKLAFEGEVSAESVFEIIETITNSAMDFAGENEGGRLAVSNDPEIACATISFVQGELANKIMLDFGDGCEGPDGKLRNGKISVEYTGGWFSQGSIITTILQNFYVDGLKVEGTRIVTSQGINSGILSLSVQISGGKITWPDGQFITRESTRTHKLMLNDALTAIELQVTGTASGVTRDGIEYEVATVEPLVFTTSCNGNAVYLPVSGIKTITVPELPVFTINYGDGDCDNKFTVIINRGSKEISL